MKAAWFGILISLTQSPEKKQNAVTFTKIKHIEKGTLRHFRHKIGHALPSQESRQIIKDYRV